METYTEIKINDLYNWGTNCTFEHPTPKRKYIKILALCLNYAPMSLIYPNTKHPITHQVHDLCRAGYLAKYKKGNRIYYKTTSAGLDLICRAVRRA